MTDKKFNPNDYMTELRGKKYLPVAARVAWFRDNHPTGSIDNDVIVIADMVLMRARVIVDGVVIATGHATKRSGQGTTWAGREIEKAETAAMGRALAVAGYGTMNADDELDDNGYLSDAPIDAPAKPKQQRTDKPDGFSPAPPPAKPDATTWSKDAAQAWATTMIADTGLSQNELLTALKISRLSEWTGTEAAATAAVTAYIDTKAIPA